MNFIKKQPLILKIRIKKRLISQPLIFALLLFNFQNAHRTSLGANAAGNALGNGILLLMYHHLGGANFHALAAADAELLVDHINTGLGVLCDSTVFTDLHTFAALNAGHRLGRAVLFHDTNAGIVLVEFLIKSYRASTYAFQASHTRCIFFYYKFLHKE